MKLCSLSYADSSTGAGKNAPTFVAMMAGKMLGRGRRSGASKTSTATAT